MESFPVRTTTGTDGPAVVLANGHEKIEAGSSGQNDIEDNRIGLDLVEGDQGRR